MAQAHPSRLKEQGEGGKQQACGLKHEHQKEDVTAFAIVEEGREQRRLPHFLQVKQVNQKQ